MRHGETPHRRPLEALSTLAARCFPSLAWDRCTTLRSGIAHRDGGHADGRFLFAVLPIPSSSCLGGSRRRGGPPPRRPAGRAVTVHKTHRLPAARTHRRGLFRPEWGLGSVFFRILGLRSSLACPRLACRRAFGPPKIAAPHTWPNKFGNFKPVKPEPRAGCSAPIGAWNACFPGTWGGARASLAPGWLAAGPLALQCGARQLRVPQAGETPTPPWLRSQRRSAFLRSSAFP